MTTDDEKKLDEEFYNVGNYKLTYMVTVPSVEHYNNRIKIGDATYHTNKTLDEIKKEASIANPELFEQGFITTPEIEAAAEKRVKEWAGTADLPYKIEFSALNVRKTKRVINGKEEYENFRDYSIHSVLQRSGYKKKHVQENKKNGEWFEIDLHKAIEGFRAVLESREYITENFNGKSKEKIILRDEQKAAVSKTKKYFKKNKGIIEKPCSFLWNAIMRFGKTLTTYELVKNINQDKKFDDEINRVLIITHRPVVVSGWYEDFHKVFDEKSGWQFGSKKKGNTWETLDKEKPFVYFASIHDLRGSYAKESVEEDSQTSANTPSKADYGASEAIEPNNEATTPNSVEVSLNGFKNSSHADEISEIELNEESAEILELDKVSEEEIREIYSKNKELFATEFDLIVIDEGHEGTKTKLAKRFSDDLKVRYHLHLSGTPFNIIEEFDEENTFDWTYIDERQAAEKWLRHRELWDEYAKNTNPDAEMPSVNDPGDFNPYANLPKLEIRTYDIENTIENANVQKVIDSGNKVEFSLNKFFEVDSSVEKQGRFYNKSSKFDDFYSPFKDPGAVSDLLNMIFKNDSFKPENERKMFPFGDSRSRDHFAHTLWIVPSLPSAKALHEMLNEIDSSYYVINATGKNDSGKPLEDVQKAIKNNARTITLSVGKLTVGTTVPEWTAVFMMSNMSSPMAYMQTIFRVKSSGSLFDGRVKEMGYVFDFNPDRSLQMVSQAASSSIRKKKSDDKDGENSDKENSEELSEFDKEQETVDEILRYLPIIAYDGSKFKKTNSNSLMSALNRVYINDTVNRGFYSTRLFAVDLHNIGQDDVNILDGVKEIVGASVDSKLRSLPLSKSSLTDSQSKELKEKQKEKKLTNSKQDLSDEEKKLKEDRDNRRKIIKILQSVAIRVPLLVMAQDIRDDSPITLSNFADDDRIDSTSWNEFMPKGFTKDHWKDITKFFNPAIFEGSCQEVINRVRKMENMLPLERVFHMAKLFATVKNPDKETVLTPFRVINMQVASTLGGLRWMNDEGDWICKDEKGNRVFCSSDEVEDSNGSIILDPELINPCNDSILTNAWNSSSSFYDINSKSALYLLYAAATMFKLRWDNISQEHIQRGIEMGVSEFDQQMKVWDKIVKDQIFINVRVPYSKRIAERVLLGYNRNNVKFNCSVVDVISLRNELKDISIVAEQKDGKTKNVKISSNDVYKLIGWVLLGVKDKKNMGVDERLAMINENVAEALKKADENEDKFTAVLSNPPYQNSNEGNSHQIYADFYITGRIIAEKLSMIFPLGWQTSSGNGTGSSHHKSMREDKKLVLVDNYYENPKESPIMVFPSAGTGGVSIVFADSSRSDSNTVIFYEYGISVDENKDLTKVVYWSDKTQKIFESIHSVLSTGTMDSKISGRAYFGLYGYFTTDPKRNEYALVSSDYFNNSIRFWSRNKNDSRYSWWYISNDLISKKINQKDASSWKVVWPKSGAWANHRRSMVFKPDELFSDTFICAFFDSKDHANNFQTYFRTLFYRFIISETAADQNAYAGVHRYVPDLSTIQNPRTGKIGWDSDWIDEDLKILFKDVLTDEDWEYIEKTALASDGGRR